MGKYAELLKAIDRFILKADDELSEQLTIEGYLDSKYTVEEINELEERLTDILQHERDNFISGIDERAVNEVMDEILPELLLADSTDEEIAKLFKEKINEFMTKITDTYIKSYDKELAFGMFTTSTVAWIDSWSEELGHIMKLSSYDKLQSVLSSALEKGESIQTVTNNLMEAYEFSRKRARATAMTEILTAHRKSAYEVAKQSPAVSDKKWVHTGKYKYKPRLNHQANPPNGKLIPKKDRFELHGADGNIYSPMIPGDTDLPPSERVYCHCIVQYITDASVLGLTLEERETLQRKAIEEDDGLWEKELDARNKAKAGINEDTIKYDWLKAKSKGDQIKYFNGVKSKWALLESGVIQDDKSLERMFTSKSITKNGITTEKRVPKTLKQLSDDGIITVSNTVLNHSTFGEWANPSKAYPNGRISGGGHGQRNIDELVEKKIGSQVKRTYSNGVRIGGVEGHKNKFKVMGTVGQSWFPKSWDDDKILCAGTYVANKGIANGITVFGEYDGVRIGVYLDADKKVSTIFPDNSKQPFNNKWEVNDSGK